MDSIIVPDEGKLKLLEYLGSGSEGLGTGPQRVVLVETWASTLTEDSHFTDITEPDFTGYAPNTLATLEPGSPTAEHQVLASFGTSGFHMTADFDPVVIVGWAVVSDDDKLLWGVELEASVTIDEDHPNYLINPSPFLAMIPLPEE